MTIHTYPFHALLTDYGRAGGGLALTALPLLLSDMVTAVAYVLAVLAVLFAVYGLRTALRQVSRLELDEAGLRLVGPQTKAIAWSEVEAVDLRYFSTRRDRRNGWMQLYIRGPSTTIRLESSLNGFPEVARRCFEVAGERRIPLGPGALTNLQSLGPERPLYRPRWSTS